MSSSLHQDQYIQQILEKQRLLLEARNQDLLNLKQKLAEYEHVITEKDYYVARLEMDLEHAICQCQKIAATKGAEYHSKWNNHHAQGSETENNK